MPSLNDIAPELVRMIASDSEQAWIWARVSSRLRAILVPRSWEELTVRVDHPNFGQRYGSLPIPVSTPEPVKVKRIRLVSEGWISDLTFGLGSVTRLCEQLPHLNVIIWDLTLGVSDTYLARFPPHAKVWVTVRGGILPPSGPCWGASAPLDLRRVISDVTLDVHNWGCPVEPLDLVGLEDLELYVAGSQGTSTLPHFFSRPLPALKTLRMSLSDHRSVPESAESQEPVIDASSMWALQEPVVFKEPGYLQRSTLPHLRRVIVDFYGCDGWTEEWSCKMQLNVKEAFEGSSDVTFTFHNHSGKGPSRWT